MCITGRRVNSGTFSGDGDPDAASMVDRRYNAGGWGDGTPACCRGRVGGRCVESCSTAGPEIVKWMKDLVTYIKRGGQVMVDLCA